MTSTGMEELIARLEKATGPDRKIDGDIAVALGLDHGPREFVDMEARSIQTHDEIAAYYTASIDAALTLVPEGCWWVINSGLVEHKSARCLIGNGHDIDATGEYVPTPPLAVCIAALKARIHG